MTYRLLPEWHKHEAIILAWPDRQTDWADWLDAAQKTYCEIIRNLNEAGVAVVLLIREQEIVHFESLAAGLTSVVLVKAHYDDTWVRDYAFLTAGNGESLQAIDFQFNGWGNKFDAKNDNMVSRNYLSNLLNVPLTTSVLVCEGGALEIDDQGTLLSTASCLLNPMRNGSTTTNSYAPIFRDTLGAKSIHIFKNGQLSGDDTDGHIDTLVRFTPFNGVVIQGCFNRPDDDHFEALKKLCDEVANALPERNIFELPLPEVTNEEGARLPASYANFLISNNNVFVPVYDQPEDELALNVISDAFPSYKIVSVDCHTLVKQFGSLHCVTMQVPSGMLKKEVTQRFGCGVHVL